MKKKFKKEFKMHTFLGCTYISQDFTLTQENFARSPDRETVTFRNSDRMPNLGRSIRNHMPHLGGTIQHSCFSKC